MKSTKILLTALSLAMMLLPGCKKDVVTGIDSSKAPVKDFTYDEDASGKTSIAFYWDDQDAIKAGATSFSVQLAQYADFKDIDMYDSKIGKTISATSAKHDAVTMEGLTESTRYYARVRANYPRSIYSEWTQLKIDGNVVCIAVGHGVVVMEFVTPSGLTATAKKYNKFVADWGIVAPAEGYAPEYKKASESTWTTAPTVTEPTFTVDDAEEGTEYNIRVRAFRTLDGGQMEYTDYAETSVTTPVRTAHELNTAADVLKFFSTDAAAAGNSDLYKLTADVDLGGAEIACAASFIGELNGQGHVISNAKAAAGLISTLEGTISNIQFKSVIFESPAFNTISADGLASLIIFDSSCQFSFADPASSVSEGILCGVNEGTVKLCSTAVKVAQTVSTLPGESYFGGLIGKSTGYVEGCTATGAFDLNVTAPTKAIFHWIGGVIGQVAGKAGKTVVKDCINAGPVSLQFATAAYFTLGGVVGGTPAVAGASDNYGIFDGLVNKGDVTDHYISGGSGAYPNVGGCAGYVEGYIKNCSNSAKITIQCDSPSATWTNGHIGCVAGAVTQGADHCTNTGSFLTDLIVAGGTAGAKGSGCTSSTCFAGVIGAAGPYSGASSSIVFSELHNLSDLNITLKSVTGTPNSYFGGVIGYCNATVQNCTNTRAVNVSIPTSINRVGGVVGGCAYDLAGCNNEGNVTLTCNLIVSTLTTWRYYMGGICGEYSADKCTVKTNTNSGNVTLNVTSVSTTSRDSGVAGIVGCDLGSGNTYAEDNANTGTLTGNSPAKVVIADIVAQGLN